MTIEARSPQNCHDLGWGLDRCGNGGIGAIDGDELDADSSNDDHAAPPGKDLLELHDGKIPVWGRAADCAALFRAAAPHMVSCDSSEVTLGK